MRQTSLLADLVGAARDGDESAWERIVQRYSGLLVGVIWRYGLGEADVTDVVQVTWRRLVQHLDGIREPEAVGAWLLTTACQGGGQDAAAS